MAKSATRACRLLLLPALFIVLLAQQARAQAEAVLGGEMLASAIQRLLETGPTLPVANRSVDAAPLLDFYRARDFQPAWTDEQGPDARAQALAAAMQGAAAAEGLDPHDYELAASIRRLAPQATAGVVLRAAQDVAVSALVVRYALDVRRGRALPAGATYDQRGLPQGDDMPALLRAAGSEPADRFVAALAPADPLYTGLRSALARHRSVAAAGGWPSLADGPRLAPGASDPRVPTLRRRLQLSGDLATAAPRQSNHYDDELKAAMQAFQARHGLAADGVIGARTREALNVPVEQRIRQILANLERARWLPDDLGSTHVLVNLADFELDVVSRDVSILHMRVVVGERDKETPAFSDQISYIEVNPYWNVPRSIALKEKLPKLRQNPGALAAQNIRVFGPEGEINPWSVDWSAVGTGNFPYRFRQDPGERNALGRIKFMFPNAYDVYLHDTPSRALFQRSVRAFSHGCIRVEKPLELAETLLRDTPGWGRQRLESTIDSGRNRAITLAQPVPIHLVYLTAWVDPAGRLQFRDDLYSRDARLFAAFDAPSR